MNLIDTYRNDAIQILNTVYKPDDSQRTASILIQSIMAIAFELITAARESKPTLVEGRIQGKFEVSQEIGVKVTHLIEKIFKEVFCLEMTFEYAEVKTPQSEQLTAITIMNKIVGEPFKQNQLCLKWEEKNEFMCSKEKVEDILARVTASKTKTSLGNGQLTYSYKPHAPYVDVHLKCNGIDYYAHRLILMTRSRWFSEHLAEYKMGNNLPVVINCSPQYLEIILNYMYHEKLPNQNDPHFYSGLIKECETYGLQELAAWGRQKLDKFILQSTITEENIQYHFDLCLTFDLQEAITRLLSFSNSHEKFGELIFKMLPKKHLSKTINLVLAMSLKNLYPRLLTLSSAHLK
jgi:hypothetical protein